MCLRDSHARLQVLIGYTNAPRDAGALDMHNKCDTQFEFGYCDGKLKLDWATNGPSP